MRKMAPVVSTEINKFFRSKIPLLSLIALGVVPIMGGFFMSILKDPDLAQNLGLISTKANVMGSADWPSFFGLLSQAISIGGLIVFGFIMSWIFGREYVDRTINDLLALPKSRGTIVVSKFFVAIMWSFILSLFVLISGIVTGKIVGIPSWSPDVVVHGIFIFIICAVLTIFLSTPVAFFASVGRGYLLPLGYVIFTLVLAQIISLTGYGQYFPWSISALIAGVMGENGASSGLSIGIVFLTSVLGMVGTILWWKYADHD